MTPILSSRPLTPLGILVKSLIPRALNKGKKKNIFRDTKRPRNTEFCLEFPNNKLWRTTNVFFYFLLGIESAVVRASAVEVA